MQFSYEGLRLTMCVHTVLILSAKNVSFPQKRSLMGSGEMKHLHILNGHSYYLPVCFMRISASLILSQYFPS